MMPPKQCIIWKLIIPCLLLLAGAPSATAQQPRNDLFFTHLSVYKDGLLFINNSFVKDRRKNNELLTDEYRPRGVYACQVYGSRSTLCFTTYTADLPMPRLGMVEPRFDETRDVALNPANLLVRTRRNGKTVQDWKAVALATPSVDSFLHYYPTEKHKEIFVLADDSLQINDVLVVDGRLSMDTTILFTYYIRRIARPIRPRLMAWSHEWEGTESRITPQMINYHVLGKNTVMKLFERGELEGGDGHHFRNELIVPTSRFIFLFGKADASFTDSTMEYRILGGRYKDSTWSETGHLIMMDGLTGDERYILEVRYTGYPENTVVYSFVTKPYWFQRNWFRWLVAGVLVTLILLLIVASYRRKLAKEQAKKAGLADRLRNMQAQLNPHFIFNALGSIQALMSRQENDKAHQYLSTFGNLLRNVLTNSNQDNTTLDQEIGSLAAYLQLEQLRFRFQYSIDVANDIQTTTVSLPVMLLQPLVENAIRHGIEGMDEKGHIHLSFLKEGTDLRIIINDNGKGFDATQPTAGYGLKLVREKIQLINTLQEQEAISIDLQSSNTGTTILLIFKNWLA